MTHSTKIRGFIFGSALFALASLTYTGSAHASSTFPAALRDALQAKFGKSYCVPLCNACHQTTLGGPANYNPFGAFLFVKRMSLPPTFSTAQIRLSVEVVIGMNFPPAVAVIR